MVGPDFYSLEDHRDSILNQHLVIEEKLDGEPIGISFDLNGGCVVQNKHSLVSPKEKRPQYEWLFRWLDVHSKTLLKLVGTRYQILGEWLYFKRNIFYDTLPHYFLEFGVLDLEKDIYLSSLERKRMFSDSPIVSAPVIWNGVCPDTQGIEFLASDSAFKSKKWKQKLTKSLENSKEKESILINTDPTSSMEGLILKVEKDNQMVMALKYQRPNFLGSLGAPEIHIKNELNKDPQLLFRK